MPSVEYGSLPFAEQIKFFRTKVNVPTQQWTDVYAQEHNHAFMVAGAMQDDMLKDFNGAITKAIENGTTLEEFRKDFDNIVARYGWQYNGGRNWRTRVIYETNLRQSYNAGREAQMAAPELQKLKPYRLYRHGGSKDPRLEHLAWDGLVLKHDDSFWETHAPANGWGCSCKSFAISKKQMERMGLTLGAAPEIEYEEHIVGARTDNPKLVKVPKGIDAGFEYRPNNTNRIKAVTPKEGLKPISILDGVASATDAMPSPRAGLASPIAVDGLSESEVAQTFLDEFGANGKESVMFEDVTGTILPLSYELFKTSKGKWKAFKNNRQQQLHILIDTIKNPDEVWAVFEPINKTKEVRRRYLRVMPDGSGVAVFEFSKKQWKAITAFSLDEAYIYQTRKMTIREYIEEQRKGVRLYRFGE